MCECKVDFKTRFINLNEPYQFVQKLKVKSHHLSCLKEIFCHEPKLKLIYCNNFKDHNFQSYNRPQAWDFLPSSDCQQYFFFTCHLGAFCSPFLFTFYSLEEKNCGTKNILRNALGTILFIMLLGEHLENMERILSFFK